MVSKGGYRNYRRRGSYVVEVVVNAADRFDGVEAVELESASVEGLGEVAVAGEVLLLDLEISRPARPVVHVVCVVHRVADVQAVLRVL